MKIEMMPVIGMVTQAKLSHLDAVVSVVFGVSNRDMSKGIITMIDNQSNKQYLVSHFKSCWLDNSSNFKAGSKSHTYRIFVLETHELYLRASALWYLPREAAVWRLLCIHGRSQIKTCNEILLAWRLNLYLNFWRRLLTCSGTAGYTDPVNEADRYIGSIFVSIFRKLLRRNVPNRKRSLRCPTTHLPFSSPKSIPAYSSLRDFRGLFRPPWFEIHDSKPGRK